MTKVAQLAEKQNHHPRWENEWNKVQIWLSMHEANETITDKDRKLADSIDQLTVDTKTTEKTSKQGTTVDHIKIYADGGSRGNPGPSSSGYVLLDQDGVVLVDKGVYLGVTTNNQAEYQALKYALEEARRLRAKRVDVYMDSMLVINQMKKIFKVKNRDLWPIHDAILTLVKEFEHVSFTHVPRELNKQADAAVNRVLDEEMHKSDHKMS